MAISFNGIDHRLNNQEIKAIPEKAQPTGLKTDKVSGLIKEKADKLQLPKLKTEGTNPPVNDSLDKLSLEAVRGSKAQLSDKQASGLSVNQIKEQEIQSEDKVPDLNSQTCHQILRIGEVDVPIFGVVEQGSNRKPPGSGYIKATLKLGRFPTVNTFLCIDTGAEKTVCTSQFLIHHFGEQAIYKLKKNPNKNPEYKSATGHLLDLLGSVKISITMGTYSFEHRVVVFNHDVSSFLVGNDCVYNRLIYNQGKSISFAEKGHKPVPILYFRAQEYAMTFKQIVIAPKSSALVPVQVSQPHGSTAQSVMISRIQVEEADPQSPINHILDTVATVQADGTAMVWVENDTEDCLFINPNQAIAQVSLVTENRDSVLFDGQSNEAHIRRIIEEVNPELKVTKGNKWPLSAIKTLQERFPINVKVNWDFITSKSSKPPISEATQATEVEVWPHVKLGSEPDNSFNSKARPYQGPAKAISRWMDDGKSAEVVAINHIQDPLERGAFLDGLATEFPDPAAHELCDLPSDPDNTEWIENIDRKHLSSEQWDLLKDLILRKSGAFSKHKYDIGCYNGFKVHLPLKPGTGYLYSKPRTLNAKHREIAAEHTTELLKQGIIRPSRSPHATNVVIVSKKSGPNEPPKSRMCVDLREVNQHSVPSRFPNLSLEDSLEKIQGAKFRSSFDFNQAFHQLVLDEDSIPVTAFYVNSVLYEYVRLPFGHVQAMQSFCSLMAILCHNYPPACYYADDLIITTKDNPDKSEQDLFKQHLLDIEGMLDRITESNLKLSAHKCQWAFSSSRTMDWLGFTLADNLLKPQEAKVKSIKEFPRPTTAKQAISFVSLASFYRRFIKNFARIAQPLYDVGKLNKKEPFIWTEAAEEAFQGLKEALCSEAVLRLPRQGEPFTVYTDASWGSLGCVLCQVDPVDKKLHPCAYGSRKFNNSEINYSIPMKELIAIIYALSLWHFYLQGSQVILLSDCKAWSFLKLQTGISSKVSRMALAIQGYDVQISYVPGHKNKAADGLSRAYDTGETKCDDQLANKAPVLGELKAPTLIEGVVVPKDEYLARCEKYLTEEWPNTVLKFNLKRDVQVTDQRLFDRLLARTTPEYTIDKDGKVLDRKLRQVGFIPTKEKAEAIRQIVVIEDDESDQSDIVTDQSIALDTQLFKNKRYGLFSDIQYPYMHKECLKEDEEAEEASSDDESNPGSDPGEKNLEEDSGEINFVSINDNIFSLEAYSELQVQDDFCFSKIKGVKEKVADVINSGYFIKKRVLMRQMSTNDGQKFNVVCVPKTIVKPLMESTHNSLAGHFGSQRYLLDMKRKYFWPSMKKDIIAFHKQCIPCQVNDKYPVKVKSGEMIRPKAPLDILYIDIATGLCRSIDGYHCIMLVYDAFSRFAQAIPLKSEKADYIVQQFMSQYVAKYGMPKHIHSDNGRNMDSTLIRHLCLMLGALKSSTPPYHPASNPCETICGAIVNLIRKALTSSDQRYWPQCLPFALNAYNSTVHTATGYTPNSIFFGRFNEPSSVPLVPFDSEAATVNEYFTKLRRFQELSFQIVTARNERLAKARKVQMDKNAITPKYKIGDYVLVKNLQPGTGPGQVKLRAKYIGPFRVIKVYQSSLALVPWSLNSKLEQFYRDPNLFRLAHRGDLKTFEVRIAANRDVKPYKGRIDTQIIVDPIMIGKFLDTLDLDNNPDLSHVLTSHNASDDLEGHNSEVESLSDLSSEASPFVSSSDSESSDSDGPSDGDHPLPILDDGRDSNNTIVDPSLPESSVETSNDASHHSSGAGNNSWDSLFGLESLFRTLQSEASSLESEIDEADFQRNLLQYFDIKKETDSVDNHLRSVKRLLKLAAEHDTKFGELQELAMSADPDIRIKAEKELDDRLNEMYEANKRKLVFTSSNSSNSEDDRKPPHMTSSPFGHILTSSEKRISTADRRDKAYLKQKGRIQDLAEQLDSSFPIPDKIKAELKRSLDKANNILRKARHSLKMAQTSSSELDLSQTNSSRHSNPQDAEVPKQQSDPSTDATPSLDVSQAPDNPGETQYFTQPSSEDEEEEKVQPAPVFKPVPQPRASKNTTREESLEWDNDDLNHDVQPPPAENKPDADARKNVSKWLQENYDINIEAPMVTRSGRQIKHRVIYDPADEIEREKQLKQAHKAQLPIKIQPTQSTVKNSSAQVQPGPSGTQAPVDTHSKQYNLRRSVRQAIAQAQSEALAKSARDNRPTNIVDSSDDEDSPKKTGKLSSKHRPKSSKK